MKFDKTCCGTTCDAKANAEYVAKLEEFVNELVCCRQSADFGAGMYDLCYLGDMVIDVMDNYEELIKHAQQNNSTTE